jgi:hypothetical protein
LVLLVCFGNVLTTQKNSRKKNQQLFGPSDGERMLTYIYIDHLNTPDGDVA